MIKLESVQTCTHGPQDDQARIGISLCDHRMIKLRQRREPYVSVAEAVDLMLANFAVTAPASEAYHYATSSVASGMVATSSGSL